MEQEKTIYSTASLKAYIQEGGLDSWFASAYLTDEDGVASQRARYLDAIDGFENAFGAVEEVHIFSAPGRTEVGGNHTDHNHGKVLAASVNLDIIGIVAKTQSMIARVLSKGFEMDVVDLSDLTVHAKESNHSASLVRGVAAGFAKEGYAIGGFDAYTTSSVLKGSGLSSSAAFEVFLGAALSGLYNDNRVEPVKLAQLGQYAENAFFGKASGLLDQTTSAVGSFITADFADPANPVVERVNFDFSGAGVDLVIVDTGGSHADLSDEYSAIPKEMKKVAAYFGKEVLRQVDEQQVLDHLAELRTAVGDRGVLRALHFYEENRRVEKQAAALAAGDFATFEREIIASGDSSYRYLQNVFCVQTPQEQPVSLGLCLAERLLAGKGGAWRVHGGGFAGTIQAFVPKATTAVYCDAMKKLFGPQSCYVLGVRPYGSTMVL